MFSLYRNLITVTLLAIVSSASFAAEPISVDIANLAGQTSSYLGKSIATNGCLVNTPHGNFITPCGSDDWHQIVLISDPEYLGIDAFNKLGIDFASQVKANFTGKVVEKWTSWPRRHQQLFLQLDSISNPSTYEP